MTKRIIHIQCIPELTNLLQTWIDCLYNSSIELTNPLFDTIRYNCIFQQDITDSYFTLLSIDYFLFDIHPIIHSTYGYCSPLITHGCIIFDDIFNNSLLIRYPSQDPINLISIPSRFIRSFDSMNTYLESRFFITRFDSKLTILMFYKNIVYVLLYSISIYTIGELLSIILSKIASFPPKCVGSSLQLANFHISVPTDTL